MASDRGRGLVDKPVVEALVIAAVKSLLLERPLHVPVGLGDEHQIGKRLLYKADQSGQYS